MKLLVEPIGSHPGEIRIIQFVSQIWLLIAPPGFEPGSPPSEGSILDQLYDRAVKSFYSINMFIVGKSNVF